MTWSVAYDTLPNVLARIIVVRKYVGFEMTTVAIFSEKILFKYSGPNTFKNRRKTQPRVISRYYSHKVDNFYNFAMIFVTVEISQFSRVFANWKNTGPLLSGQKKIY